MRCVSLVLLLVSAGLLAACSDAGSDLIPVRLNHKVGYVDPAGKIVINAQFDHGRPFHSGLAAVRLGSKWGFIDREGNYTINPQFSSVGNMKEERAWYAAESRYGYVDDEGAIVINPQFDEATDFADGLAAVRSGQQWGFITDDGKYAINPQFDQAHGFSEGLAAVRVGEKWGFADAKGKLRVNPQFDQVLPFREGLAAFLTEGRVGFIDEAGKVVIPPQFESAMGFRGGQAVVRVDARYGVINRAGKFVVNPQFDGLQGYSDGVAPVLAGSLWGFADQKGEVVVRPQFEDAKRFLRGVGAVRTGGRWGFVNKKGEVVVNPQFDQVEPVDETEDTELLGKLSVRLGSVVNVPVTAERSEELSFKLPAPAPVSIRAEGRDPWVQPVVELIQGDTRLAADANASYGRVAQIRRFLQPGDYVVRASTQSAGGRIGLTVEDPTVRDVVRIGERRTGRLSGEQPVLFRVEVPSPTYVAISFTGATSNLDTVLSLLNERGDQIGRDDDGAGNRGALIRTRLEKGLYYLMGSGYNNTTGPFALAVQSEDDQAPLRTTLSVLRTIATAWEARATDYNNYLQVPWGSPVRNVHSSQLRQMLQPTYIREVPATDGWGRPLNAAAAASAYVLASSGADGMLQTDLTTLAAGVTTGDDIVFTNGSFVAAPPQAAPLVQLAPMPAFETTDTMATDTMATTSTMR
jgi:hypothetical protein